jgi:hypothetical protein
MGQRNDKWEKTNEGSRENASGETRFVQNSRKSTTQMHDASSALKPFQFLACFLTISDETVQEPVAAVSVQFVAT